MTAWLSAADLLSFSTQLACVSLLGGMLPALMRIDTAGVRYGYFRTLLALCLALPWLQGRHATPAEAVTTATFAAVADVPMGVLAGSSMPWSQLLVSIIAAGIVLRASWIAAGLIRLHRLRTRGGPFAPLDENDDLQRLLGTRAEIRVVEGLRQPVTFGIRRPLVLLPDTIRTCSPQVQRAVLSHELIHVQRRDWMWLLIEEAIRTALWFHPCAWWLVSRVQLAREEVVDGLAVLATGTRRGYMEALAAFADETPLVPAAAFARRRHLVRRMKLLSKEADMSPRRIAWSCAVMGLVVSGGTWYAIDAFPLREAAQELRTDVGPLEKQARPITPENPVPRRTYSVDPDYPAEAAAVGADAMVTLMVVLDGTGRAAEIRRVGVAPVAAPRGSQGPDAQALSSAFDAMVRSAADAVRQWQYDPPADAPLAIRATFAFRSTGRPRLVAHDGWSPAPARLAAAPPPPPPPPPPPSAEAQQPPAWAEDALRVGGPILQPTKTKHINPVYPAEAQSAGVQGVVVIEARIGVDGKISHARVVRSVPMLDQAALDAVMRWEFTPSRMNGQLVPVMTTVTVQFTLS